jgi:hypothetical protein
MKPDFTNASESFKRLNPHLVAALSPAKPKSDRRSDVAPTDPPQKSRPRSVVVSLVGHRRRILDDDNFVGACKHLRDSIAASIGLDDGDPCLRWEYSQHQTRGAEGVVVTIQVAK